MKNIYEIPVINDNQSFFISLGGTQYQLVIYWNNHSNSWIIDIADSSGNAILSGIPIVANVDLLRPYSYMNFGGQLVAQTDLNINIPPTFDNLGSNGHLYFITY